MAQLTRRGLDAQTACYGRFRVPHAGHSKLFEQADIVLCSKSPGDYHLQRVSQFAGKPAVSIDSGTLIDWLQQNRQVQRVVLGSDNVRLAEQVLKQCNWVTVVLVPRSKQDQCSSTAVRRYFIEGTPVAELVACGFFATYEQGVIAQQLWLMGY